MQTILGYNGTIGKWLAKVLPAYSNEVTLVSRNPARINDDDLLKKANLLSKEQTRNAVEGAEIVYLTCGIPYRARLWEEQWPQIMKNVLSACADHQCKLVFLDNVYAYGKVKGWMTEQTVQNPGTRKGLVRVKISEMLMDAVEKGQVDALIARAADFYGPETENSFLNIMVIENMIKGRKANLLIGDSFLHTWAYTPDLANALAVLGNAPEAFNQIWHLPVDHNVLNGKEMIQLCAEHLGLEETPAYRIVSKAMLQIAGLFRHEAFETREMLYQYDDDYLVDSSKFDKAFDFNKTSYLKGIEKSIEAYLKHIN